MLFSRTLGILAFIALLLGMPSSASADDMKSSKYYTMSSSTDHLSFSVLLTDLNWKNTWAKDGYIRAVSGSTSIKLLTVYTKDMSSDNNENYNVFANNNLKGGMAFLTNAVGGEKELGFSNQQYWVWKGAKNDRTFAKIDYYFPPELAGKTWTFYYTYKHNNNSWYDMKLGSAYCSPTMGLKYINTTDLSYERTDARKIEITIPAMPDDVPSKLKNNRKHVGKYNFTFTYTLYNGSTRTQKETFECQSGQEKTVSVSIPMECANFKSFDMFADVQDALYCNENGEYFWNVKSNIKRTNIFSSVPQPENLNADFLQFDNKVDLAWQAYHDYGGNYKYIQASRPYVYRVETDRTGQKLSGEKWEQLSVRPEIGSTQNYSYSDNSIEPNKYYKYLILNVPKTWEGSADIASHELDNPSDATINMLGHVESGVVSISPTMDIYGLTQDVTVEDKVKLNWQYSRVPIKSKTVRFQLLRRIAGTDSWGNLDEVQAEANPAAGTVVSYTDNTIASNRVRYDYKVQLPINDNKNIFESDITTAGVISGSTITALDATKGQHADIVRVKWDVKQVGTDATNFELFRRYANSKDDFMKIYATSGNSDSYSFDDNTVQPGYYYEYKIEAYAGDKASYGNTSYQNALTAIGFCQSTGTISGRVTFGSSGTSVDDVRLTLRGDDSDEANIQQYSQRVSGASTGITWNAAEEEQDKLFGKGKDYSVQFFVRPDDNLGEGAVVGEIPNLGLLKLGTKEADGYKLLLEKYSTMDIYQNKFSQYWDIQWIVYDMRMYNGDVEDYYCDALGTIVHGKKDEIDKLHDEYYKQGYNAIEAVYFDDKNGLKFGSGDISCRFFGKQIPTPKEAVLDRKTWKGTTYDTGLKLPANNYSLISLHNEGANQTLWVNGNQSGQLSELKVTDHTNEGGNLSDFQNYYIHDNQCFYHIDIIPLDLFYKFYNAGIFKPKWFPANGELTQSSGEIRNPFSLGGSTLTEEASFTGNLLEARVWDHVLTEKERTNSADRIMSGTEAGLKIYWPMTEGIERLVFDASYSNDIPNGNHATVGNNIKPSRIVPTDIQLSRYAITNANGEYTLRGVPFIGSGSNYTVTPSKSIHVFSPVSRNGFVSASSLVLNNYDFSDQSSFTVRGKVTFTDTNIPADSIMFKIDGNIAQKDNKSVMTDANGEYELSVPIGAHTIEAFKEGHSFSTFPEDGTVYSFYQDEIINFFDNTLVNVTGRINGGFADKDEPLGFRRSTNRLGKATIKLSLGKESQCSFNYITDSHGNGEFGTKPIAVESATDAIQSTAYRAGGSHDDTYYIYITTDSLTGEFSALLPPLKYVVSDITFPGGKDYDDALAFNDNLPIIDATNTITQNMPCDSLLLDDNNVEFYRYSAKMMLQHRAAPVITVTQNGMENGAFGERTLSVRDDITREAVDVPVVKFTDTGYEYIYGHPIFVQGNSYEFTIQVSEQYTNQDTKAVVKEVPQDAVVSIYNEASTSASSIVAIDMVEDGEELHPGDVADVDELEVTSDESGKVYYGWIPNFPSLAQGYIRNLTIGVNVNGRTTLWQAPDSRTEALDMVVSGGILTGTNFVTGAPDRVDMVLRRPPGSTSYAQWSNDSVRVHTKTTTTTSSHSHGGGLDITLVPTMDTGIGTGVYEKAKFRIIAFDTKVRRTNAYDDIEIDKEQRTYSVSTTMKTPSGSKYVQNNGDTYIGRASNLSFGLGRYVGLIKQEDGSYKLGDKTSLCTSESYKTTFVLPQQYVEETLIPNWQAIIKDKLVWVPDLSDASCKKVEGEVIYYTHLKPSDYGYGSANSDEAVWTPEQYSAANGHPSYRMIDGIKHTNKEEVTDSIEWCNQQINAWRTAIRNNEKDKLKAFDDESTYLIDNFSIAGGTSVNQSTKETIATSHDLEHTKTSWNVTNDSRIGSTFNDAGVVAVLNFVNGKTTETVVNESTTNTQSTVWQISDASPATALSVDVFKSPFGWSPIFRTRGGQTCNPYEGATYTKYHNKGTELDKATMRVENPKLTVVGAAQLSGIPTGTKAEFKLQLSNESETGNACTYILEVLENSNPKGAILTMDGQKLGNGREGRSIRLGGNESIIKSLFVEQSSRSVTDYDGIKLVLRSENDVTTQSDPVELRVQFIPASAAIDIAVDHTVLNSSNYEKNKGVIVTLTNLNRQDEGLKGVRIQYRKKGLDTWSLAKEWKTTPETSQDQPIPEGTSFSWPVSFSDDGIYELRAQTYGLYGTEEVTYASQIIEVTQDLRGPKILGVPQPEFGILSYSSRNDSHIRFNEPINTNALSKTDNFRIEGSMGNAFTTKLVPDVAVQLNGDGIATQTTYNTGNTDIACELWFYRQGDGSIISLGSDDIKMSLTTHDNGKAVIRYGTGEQVLDTDVIIPANIWNYLALTYHMGEEDGQGAINAIYVNADTDSPVYIAKDMPAEQMLFSGKFHVGGDGMTAMVRDVAMWATKKTVLEMYHQREELKANHTPGLVGYWQMNEGHGTTVVDRINSSNIVMPTESWYINNRNLATKFDYRFDGMRIDISTYAPRATDNFAIEMWFRGIKGENIGLSELVDFGNDYGVSATPRGLGLNHTVTTEVGVMATSETLSEVDYCDDQWHHFAINVRRGSNATFYIDGQPIKTMPESSILPPRGTICFGRGFKGDIDEIRIWNAALTGNLIANRRYERLDSTYTGLIAYFPMESIHRTQSGTVTTEYSLDNFGNKAVISLEIANKSLFTQSLNAPALLPGSQRMRLNEKEFSFTASEDEIYIQFPDNVLPLMDGNDFTVTISNVKDVHGNISEPVEWLFQTDFAIFDWLTLDNRDYIEYDRSEPLTFTQRIYTLIQTTQSYEILNLPTWMTVDQPTGTVDAYTKTLTFTILPSAPIGRHNVHIYISDANGIKRGLSLTIIVSGDEPEWSFNRNLYESSMAIVGQIFTVDRINENTSSMIGAFDQLGLCRGIAHPEYMPTRDSYYVNIYVYGNPDDQYGKLTFKMYDASTGTTYPLVNLKMPDATTTDTLEFVADGLLGTYNTPVEFRAAADIMQPMNLPTGWTWASIYVMPHSTAIADVLPKEKNKLTSFQNIKAQTEFSAVDAKGNIQGEVTHIVPGKMYKLQMNKTTTFDIIGRPINVKDTMQTMHKGFNWFGSLSSEILSPAEAFADLKPEPNDMVKNRSQVALYRGNGIWEGNLQSIIPGEGYIYESKADGDKSFHYPKLGTQTSTHRAPQMAWAPAAYYTPADPYLFPDNMNVIAVVVKDGQRLMNAEIGAFVGEECRGAIRSNLGSEYYFLTVMGSASDDKNSIVELRIYADGKEYVDNRHFPFVNDMVWGNLDEPYVIDLDDPSGITTLYTADDSDDGWYSLQGYKLMSRPTKRGVYIHNGVKVVVE